MVEEAQLHTPGHAPYGMCPGSRKSMGTKTQKEGLDKEMKIRHFAISQQGDSHVKSGKNCQDASGTRRIINEKLKLELAVAAIADGVGSCDYSEFGSKIAVETVLDMLGRELVSLPELSKEAVSSLIKRAFQQACDNIESEASEKELPFLLFDTTLTVAMLVEDGRCYVGHIGDDGIVALFADGTYSMITTRIEGEEANSVVPLSSGEGNWQFGVAGKTVATLALMTDGLLDKSVGSERMNNRVFYPFFKPMFENIMENDQDENDLRSFWNDYLSDAKYRSQYGITDDITLAVVQIPEILKKVPPVLFDEKKWDEDTKTTRENINEALGLSPSANSTETTSEPQPGIPSEPDSTPSPMSDSGEKNTGLISPTELASPSEEMSSHDPVASNAGRQPPPKPTNITGELLGDEKQNTLGIFSCILPSIRAVASAIGIPLSYPKKEKQDVRDKTQVMAPEVSVITETPEPQKISTDGL